MRIILFHQYFLGKHDSGGSRWNQFCHYLSEQGGHQIDVMAGNIHYATGEKLSAKSWYSREAYAPDITLHRTWTYAGYNQNFIGRLIGYLSYTFSSLWQSLFLGKPNVIIVTSPPIFVGLSALILSRLKGVPFIFEVRDLWPESVVATGVLSNKYLVNMLYFLEKELYKHAAKIVVLTPAFAEDIGRRYPQHSGKIKLITNAADFDLMQPASKNNWVRAQYGWGQRRVFAYFGAHGVANDLIQVIEVARSMIKRDDILFVLIGDGMQKPLLKSKAEEYGLKNIQFIDSVSKKSVGDFINAADICMAILKKTDTFKGVYPNKVFDYMSCKKPILITIDGITRELVETANCGLYSEPENIYAFQQNVEYLANMSDEALESMGENGFRYATKHFDREKLAQTYQMLLEELQA